MQQKQLNLASSLFDQLVTERPDDLEYAAQLGQVNQLLGDLQSDTGGFETAEPTYAKVVETFETLLYQIPGVRKYQFALANVYLTMGQQQPPQSAFVSLSQAQRILSNLSTFSEGDPKSADYQFTLANVYLAVAERQRPEEAAGSLQQAITILEAIEEESSANQQVDEMLRFLGGALEQMQSQIPQTSDGAVQPRSSDDPQPGSQPQPNSNGSNGDPIQ